MDWGDGSPEDTITAWDQPEINHTYSASGIYTVEISGTELNGWGMQFRDKHKIMSITQWGIFQPGNLSIKLNLPICIYMYKYLIINIRIIFLSC